MAFASIDLESRPIKIAFLVDYNDKKSLKTAVRINSVLWGGEFNPIIPVYKRLPRSLTNFSRYMSYDRHAITNGYLAAFDPDYVVNLSSASKQDLDVHGWQFIKEEDIFPSKGLSVSYGISLFEVLDYVKEQEFKYQRIDPPEISDVQFGNRYQLFFGSIFGYYPPKTRRVFLGRYESFGIKKKIANISNYLGVYREVHNSIQDLCNYYFTLYGQNGSNSNVVFLMDATEWQDIVDYINIRATGLNVLPVALQTCASTEIVDLASKFVEKNYRKYNDNGVYYSTTILKSSNCTDEQHKAFHDSLNVQRGQDEHKMSLQTWIPRIWDSWARNKDGIHDFWLEHKSESFEFANISDFRLKVLLPDFIKEKRFDHKPRFANVIEIRTYGSEDYPANIFPTNIERPDRILSLVGAFDWRFSQRGIVYLPNSSRDNIRFHIPKAQDVYDAWQKSVGIKAHTSQPGKLAQHIVKKLGGPNSLDVFASEELIKLLQKLTNAKGETLSINYDEFRGASRRIANQTKWGGDGKDVLERLLHDGVFELGADIECANCGRTTWYKLAEVKERLTCPTCLDEIAVGETSPRDQIKWSYRPAGLFRIPDLAQGSYVVVLTLRFFEDIQDMTITPRYSFESDDGQYEADLGVLAKASWFDGGQIIHLVGECKGFGRREIAQFSNKEINKMKHLGNKKDNSIIVFSTLRRSLTNTDKSRLKGLLYQLREARYKKEGKVELLILTGNELFAKHSLSETWEELGEPHKKFAKKANYLSLFDLCDTTQRLYLDAEGWGEWWDAKRKASEAKNRPT